MNAACLEHQLTDEERRTFEEQGYLVVPDVLPAEMIQRLIAAADRVAADYRARNGTDNFGRINALDFIGKDDEFMELVDWPRTFAKVWGLLGWNIQIYHTHLTHTAPEAPDSGDSLKLSWHQDSGRLNQEMEGNPRPRISLKVAYFLTDCTQPGRGNFYIVPGSHLRNEIDLPGGSRGAELPDAIPVLVPPGTAVFFDRRLWHSASANYWTEPRRVLFYGYSYRWLRPRDDISVSHYWEQLDPIRRQLFGASPTGGYGYTSPSEQDVPLRAWIREQLGEAAAR